MAKEKKSIVDEALLDINVIQEALKKNTKEILRATMHEEIDEIVKEHVINEAGYEEEDIPTDDTEDIEAGEEAGEETEGGEDAPEMEDADDDESGEDIPAPLPADGPEEPETPEVEPEMDYDEMDLTAASDEEVIKVFKKLSAEDEIEVVSDKEVHITDPDSGNEYTVMLGGDKPAETGAPIETPAVGGAIDAPEMEDEIDIDVDVDEPEMEDDIDIEGPADESEEPVYEITLDEDIVRGQGHDTHVKETPAPNKGEIEGQKAPVGDKNKDNWAGDNLEGGFTEEDPNGGKDGHAEHVMEGEEGEVTEGDELEENKSRAQPDLHAQRVRPEGKKEYRTAPIGRANESVSKEKFNELLIIAKKLQTENKEVKQALKQFRKMLAESVVYNTNLTYMVRIITEHSTSKEEKKEIMQRFDGVKTLQESKSLYKTISGELANKKPITESMEKKIEKTQTSGSSKQLNESTAYVDESTKRIKDLIKRVEQR